MRGLKASSEAPRPLRSMLFVPGDSEKKRARAVETAADALILDLEDSVAPSAKAAARRLTAELLRGRRRREQSLWVRINALDDEESESDLEAVVAARPDGIVLPKAASADDVARLGARLEALERRAGLRPGATAILPIATETPAAVFALASYAHAGPRLAALTWGAEDLSVAVGAASAVDERSDWLPPYQFVRASCLFAAAAAGVPAIDTVYADFRDPSGLRRRALGAKRDGFSGMLAIHPAQVDLLNETFRPGADEIAEARRIVAAFEASSGSGVIALDGRMLDRPHLARARRALALAAVLGGKNRGLSQKEAEQTDGGS